MLALIQPERPCAGARLGKGFVCKTKSGGFDPHTALQFKMSDKCEDLSAFMKTQLDVVQKHLDEHKYLRQIEDKNEALDSFINDYGWLIRELYCTRICKKREGCTIAAELSGSGDLLSKRVKKKNENS